MTIRKRLDFNKMVLIFFFTVLSLGLDLSPAGFILFVTVGVFVTPVVWRILTWIFKSDPIPKACLLCNKPFTSKRENAGGFVCRACHDKTSVETRKRVKNRMRKIEEEYDRRKSIST